MTPGDHLRVGFLILSLSISQSLVVGKLQSSQESTAVSQKDCHNH